MSEPITLTADESALVKDLLALWEACNDEGFTADNDIGAIVDRAGERQAAVFDSLTFKVHPEAPNLCPKCHVRGELSYHAGSFAAPECHYLMCPDCGHQWGHN